MDSEESELDTEERTEKMRRSPRRRSRREGCEGNRKSRRRIRRYKPQRPRRRERSNSGQRSIRVTNESVRYDPCSETGSRATSPMESDGDAPPSAVEEADASKGIPRGQSQHEDGEGGREPRRRIRRYQRPQRPSRRERSNNSLIPESNERAESVSDSAVKSGPGSEEGSRATTPVVGGVSSPAVEEASSNPNAYDRNIRQEVARIEVVYETRHTLSNLFLFPLSGGLIGERAQTITMTIRPNSEGVTRIAFVMTRGSESDEGSSTSVINDDSSMAEEDSDVFVTIEINVRGAGHVEHADNEEQAVQPEQVDLAVELEEHADLENEEGFEAPLSERNLTEEWITRYMGPDFMDHVSHSRMQLGFPSYTIRLYLRADEFDDYSRFIEEQRREMELNNAPDESDDSEERREIEIVVEQGHRADAVRTDEYGDCRMCSETPSDPMGCEQCKQYLGCNVCIHKWYLTSSDGGGNPACPLCRFLWSTKPSCVPMDEIEDI